MHVPIFDELIFVMERQYFLIGWNIIYFIKNLKFLNLIFLIKNKNPLCSRLKTSSTEERLKDIIE